MPPNRLMGRYPREGSPEMGPFWSTYGEIIITRNPQMYTLGRGDLSGTFSVLQITPPKRGPFWGTPEISYPGGQVRRWEGN